jgi:Fe-S-cluster-containing dehydrogenase component
MVCSLKWEKNGVNPTLSRIRVISFPDKGVIVPRVCRLCRNPSCVSSCPKEALSQDSETGVIIVDEDSCVGCDLCVEACDFGGIYSHPSKKTVMTCDLCGGAPRCVKYCMNNTLLFLRPEEYCIVKNRSTLDKKVHSIWPEDTVKDNR